MKISTRYGRQRRVGADDSVLHTVSIAYTISCQPGRLEVAKAACVQDIGVARFL